MASRGCRLSKPKKQKKHIRKRDVSSLDVSEEWEKVGSLKNIWVYPIKSCAGVPVPEAFIEKHGARVGECRDRSLVIIDENKEMVTGRKYNSTVLLKTEYDSSNNSLTLTFPHLQPIKIYLNLIEVEGTLVESKIWDDLVVGFDCGDEAANWLSLALGCQCRLLYHGSSALSRRSTEKCIEKFPLFNTDDNALYADLSSVMLMNEESISDLNSRSNKNHFPQNFRPNFLVSGPKAFDEDDWVYLKIGECIFRNVSFTTIDYRTGKRDKNYEPLKTLRKYRCTDSESAPLFGINLSVDRVGKVKAGDDVYVLRT
ncbi:Mitochondrial amidoxime reducing component 2 [Armadillidium vulgare]|nr:Mitochondrial amidoxime reducing component 2 [Armadillidium vulgare]